MFLGCENIFCGEVALGVLHVHYCEDSGSFAKPMKLVLEMQDVCWLVSGDVFIRPGDVKSSG